MQEIAQGYVFPDLASCPNADEGLSGRAQDIQFVRLFVQFDGYTGSALMTTSRHQPKLQRDHAVYIFPVYGEGSASMETDLQGALRRCCRCSRLS